MNPFGGRRRNAARRSRGTRPAVPPRSPDSALGRETRSLLQAGARKRQAAQPAAPRKTAGSRSRTRRPGFGLRLPRVGRIVTPARAGGLLGMLGAGFLLSFVTGPSAFALARTELPQLRWTDQALVADRLGLAPGTNVFRLDTGPLEAALRSLPAVADADVRVALPDGAVMVTIREREPILAWQEGDQRYLADRDGVIFATIAAGATLPAGLAVIEDRRTGAADQFAIGDRLDPVDLDVATRLGSVTPADIESSAERLRVRITDADGFVILVDRGWSAVFGFYSPATRPTDMIPAQVRLLKSLLFGREDSVIRIVLASGTDGTYVPRPTPKPSKK